VYTTITNNNSSKSPAAVGSDKGDTNRRTTEMKDKEASPAIKGSALVQRDGAELELSSVTAQEVSPSPLDNEAFLANKRSALVQYGAGLPDGTELETLVVTTTQEVSPSPLDKGRLSGSGMQQGNRGQSSHREQPVKPYETVVLPSIESVTKYR
jgi:hypothetical protein